MVVDSIKECTQVTEAVVLQLLQRCRKLTKLEVTSRSLSEETWTQLDKNTQHNCILLHKQNKNKTYISYIFMFYIYLHYILNEKERFFAITI